MFKDGLVENIKRRTNFPIKAADFERLLDGKAYSAVARPEKYEREEAQRELLRAKSMILVRRF